MHALCGLDLVDFFRGKYSWRKLLNIIKRFPSTSHFTAARANDDEFAEQMLEAYEEAPDMGPELTDYSPVIERLDTLSDQVQDMVGVLIAVNGGKPPKVKPAKRPSTALTRAKAMQSRKRYSSLVSEVEEAQARSALRA